MNLKEEITIKVKCSKIVLKDTGEQVYWFKVIGKASMFDDLHLSEEDLMNIKYGEAPKENVVKKFGLF